jgi:hypothetical protein
MISDLIRHDLRGIDNDDAEVGSRFNIHVISTTSSSQDYAAPFQHLQVFPREKPTSSLGPSNIRISSMVGQFLLVPAIGYGKINISLTKSLKYPV